MANHRNAAIALAIIGLAQMSFDLLGWTPAKAVAGATLLSPAPKVFSAVDGFETYSAQFQLYWTDRAGARHLLPLDRAHYERLRGPYHRRNVYGAAIAYGPVLQRSEIGARMLDAIGDYAFLSDAPLLAELGVPIDEAVGPVGVELVASTDEVIEPGVFLERLR